MRPSRFARLASTGLAAALLCIPGTGHASPLLYFVHTDHLNTPRLIADQNQTTVWRWEQVEPFGANPPQEDPDGNAVIFHMPLRFPGQYFDKETNNHYNMARDYVPEIGRYLQSDPIGIYGGINTYAYVGASPLIFSDPSGLQFMGAEPPPGVGGPWKWFPNNANDRGGVWRDPSGKNANWDPSGHWDVWGKDGKRSRYDRWGNPTDLHRNPNRRASDKPIMRWGKKVCKVLGPVGVIGSIGMGLAMDEPINAGDLLCDAVWGCSEAY